MLDNQNTIQKIISSLINITFDFDIEENFYFEHNIKLGLAPEVDFYQINSKIELNEAEIFRIMKCVDENRQNFSKNCSEQNKFYVLMQI